ncbi:MAG: heavy-metal-associated domain-containing protein [Euryarchaeota archaeon]|nr:heavy-metal-associated domain-containing protein [Euryarchaeota archaeon]
MALFGKRTTVDLAVEGMTCDNCVRHVAQALERVPGVKKVDVRLPGSATVELRGEPDLAVLEAAIEKAGYKAHAA